MIKKEELIVMKAISICFKPFLKTEEALIYCNLGRTQFSKKCEENCVYKNNNGYYKKEELDRMMEGDAKVLGNKKMVLSS
ncbi:hypothetical protein DC498_10695 [Terrimonas sp.]|uniref:hypothetical protein n=1 Tax=Terrimonas sp. TaxID=1914338 RepID=UPI000D51225B|nr:hypothetical protein [Terrimonas sp.]PVD52184.1 hypothetical protein DC498_10695 [Terrimonas sp.]